MTKKKKKYILSGRILSRFVPMFFLFVVVLTEVLSVLTFHPFLILLTFVLFFRVVVEKDISRNIGLLNVLQV